MIRQVLYKKICAGPFLQKKMKTVTISTTSNIFLWSSKKNNLMQINIDPIQHGRLEDNCRRGFPACPRLLDSDRHPAPAEAKLIGCRMFFRQFAANHRAESQRLHHKDPMSYKSASISIKTVHNMDVSCSGISMRRTQTRRARTRPRRVAAEPVYCCSLTEVVIYSRLKLFFKLV